MTLSWSLLMVSCSRPHSYSMLSLSVFSSKCLIAINSLRFSQWQPRVPWPPQAHAETHTMTPNWLLDSGASHHVTPNLSNLSLHIHYEGPGDIMIDNGTNLSITHIDSETLSPPSNSLNKIMFFVFLPFKRTLFLFLNFVTKITLPLGSHLLPFL